MTLSKKVLTLLLVPIFIPIIIFYFLSKNRTDIICDLRRISDEIHNEYSLGVLFFLYTFIKSKEYRNVFFYRIYNRRIFSILLTLIYKKKETFEIHSNTIGKGFRVHHGHSTVIYANSIGENFTIWQNVTIGRGRLINGCDIPTIGNNVKIFTNSVVYGGILIGDNVKISAGTIVSDNIPSNSIVYGNPMVIKSNSR